MITCLNSISGGYEFTVLRICRFKANDIAVDGVAVVAVGRTVLSINGIRISLLTLPKLLALFDSRESVIIPVFGCTDLNFHGFLATKYSKSRKTFVTESILGHVTVGLEIILINGIMASTLTPLMLMSLLASRDARILPEFG